MASTEKVRSDLTARIQARFGIVPNFFKLAPETPEITERLWGFVEAAYLDNPLPSVFKERLFVYLSRFCAVRYCIARHVGFLLGLGRPAGDANAPIHSPEDVVRLLRRPVPEGRELERFTSLAAQPDAYLAVLPAPDSEMEVAIFGLATHIFLQTPEAPNCLESLKQLLDPVRLEYLFVFLMFIRAAHYRTKIHPELEFEDDIRELLRDQEALAECVVNDPEAKRDSITRALLDELPGLRERADKATRLLASIVENSEDAVVSKDLKGTILTWNASAERIFGYRAFEAVGQPITLIIPPELHDEELAIIEKLRSGQRIAHFETVRIHKTGRKVSVSLTISPVRDAKGQVIGASKIARDVTNTKRLEAALKESEFSVRLLKLQDEDRRHTARELHDGVGQLIALLEMDVSAMAKEKAKLGTADAKRLAKIQGLVQQLANDVRTVSYLLHPPLLDEMGLRSALQWYVEGFAERSKINASLSISEDFERLPGDLELTIFRIVQESLTNIHRHAHASSASVALSKERNSIGLEIRDDGRGMSAETRAKIISGTFTGVGLRGMRERIAAVGGAFNVESSDKGTAVKVTLPIPPTLN